MNGPMTPIYGYLGWVQTYTPTFLFFVTEVFAKGLNDGRYLTQVGWKLVVEKMRNETGYSWTVNYLQHKWNTLQREYDDWITVFGPPSEWPWDAETRHIIADNDWRACRTEDNLDAAELCTKRFPDLRQMEALFAESPYSS